MKKRQSASVSLVLILVLSGCGSQESAMDSKVETVPVSDIRFPDSVFRVTLGLTDSEPRDWSGNLRLQPGQKAELVPEHFRAGVYRHDFGAGWRTIVDPKIPNDRLTGPDSWLAHTTLDWVRYKDRARIRHPSLFVRLWDNPDQAPVPGPGRRTGLLRGTGGSAVVPSRVPARRSSARGAGASGGSGGSGADRPAGLSGPHGHPFGRPLGRMAGV